jgi:selenophosphate synthase
VEEALKNTLLDPETSGGLLICVGAGHLSALTRDMAERNVSAAHVGFGE